MNANSKQPAPTTLNDWLNKAESQLRDAGIPSARLDAELIAAHSFGKGRTWLLAHSDDVVDNTDTLDSMLSRRLDRVPLAYLTETKEFFGRPFTVTPAVLIPRPETETLVQIAKELLLPRDYVIDVGCGSGCIGITIAIECPDYDVELVDISEAALEIAGENRDNLDIDVSFTKSDLLSAIEKPVAEYVGLIVANLPYVDRKWERSPETDHEPKLALFADQNGLSLIYKLIIQAPSFLVRRGYLLLEADPEQHAAIIIHAKNHGLAHVESRDYAVLLQKS